MSQQKHILNSTLIYKRRSETPQLLLAKSHKACETSQCTQKVIKLQTAAQNPFLLDPCPIHLFIYHNLSKL